MGLPTTANASLSIFSYAAGGLIAGGVASCSFTIDSVANIAGLASGSASLSFQVSLNAAIGASAFGVSVASFAINSTAQPYAIGFMKASTVDNSVLTAKSITAEVWGAVASQNNAPDSMGAKLNSAASGGVDYSALGAAVWAHAARTLTAANGVIPTDAQIAEAVWSYTQ
jgi:hypothetical protein